MTDWVSELEVPGTCPECGARTQLNIDNEVVHSRSGNIECPPVPLSEEPVNGFLWLLKNLTT